MTVETEWPQADPTADIDVTRLQEELRAEQEMNLLLQESVADLELALEDDGWRKLTAAVADEFTPAGRRRIAGMCRAMVLAHPLIKRGVNVRVGYIWGQGVEVQAVLEGTGADDTVEAEVNSLLDDFWADNESSLTSSYAQEELERALATDGQVYLAAFTSPLTGRVQIRSTPADEIVDVITNPEDRDEPWFYLREYVVDVLESGYERGSTRRRTERRRVAYPALGWRPATRPKSINGIPVQWDAPMLHVPVNRLDGWRYGVPDVYAAVAWARMYRDFLVDWAGLTKSLSKFAWRAVAPNKRSAATTRAALASAASNVPAAGTDQRSAAGQAAVGTHNLEAIPKSGAQIDAESGKPLAGMIAAAIGVPVTILLADPGTTGARAVAETLDKPTVLEMGMRRLLWQTKLEQLLTHVITAAVEAPRGRLRGTTLIDDWGRKRTALAGGRFPTLDWTWPPLAELSPEVLINAIATADDTEKMPPQTTARLLLQALGVKDVDQILDDMTDDQGRWISPSTTAADAAVDAFNRGEDPAAATR